MSYHPEIDPLLLEVERDWDYTIALANALDEFCDKMLWWRETFKKQGRVPKAA
jgi:hypothetical protein